MSQVPRFKRFSREDFQGAPDWFEPLFLVFNEALGGIIGLLSGRLTRGDNIQGGEKVGFTFTTKDPIAGSWPVLVKVTTPVAPKHVWLTALEREDGTPITAAFSMTRTLQGDNIALSFQGLAVSTKYRASIAYE